jgi:hypothetical protein
MFGPDILVAPILFESQRARVTFIYQLEHAGSAMEQEKVLTVDKLLVKPRLLTISQSFFGRTGQCGCELEIL